MYDLAFSLMALGATTILLRVWEGGKGGLNQKLTLYLRAILHPICTGEGGKFAPLSKNRLVRDRSKIFCMSKLFFVKFLKINILRL